MKTKTMIMKANVMNPILPLSYNYSIYRPLSEFFIQ